MAQKREQRPVPTVKVGQVWKDQDPRATRYFKILSLEVGAPYGYDRAVVQACTPEGVLAPTPKSRIKLQRLAQSGSRGYALILDVD